MTPPLDFSALAKPYTAVVPIVSGRFVLNKKAYSIRSEDGWFLVEISGNKAIVKEPHYWLEAPKEKSVAGYTYNNDLIFSNFDVAKRKWKFEIKVPLLFNNAESFSPIRAIVWEDKQVFICQPWYEDTKSLELKQAFDEDKPLTEVKGITPELRTLYLFHSLEREQMWALLAVRQAKEEHEKLMQDVGYRLKVTFERSGAEMLGFSRSGNRIIVDWQIKGGDYRYNSVLDADTGQVREAGFCLNGGDRNLNATSMVLTAQEFEEDGSTYITRR